MAMSSTAEHPARHSSRWHSIDRRLPLLLILLLFAAVAALATGAYRAVAKTLLAATETRLEASAGQVQALLSRAATERQSEVAKIAAAPALRRYLAEPSDAARAAAVAALSVPAEEEQTLAVELWSSAGGLVAVARPPDVSAAEGSVGRSFRHGRGVGPIRADEGVAFYEVTAPVTGADGEPAGRVVVRRRLGSAQGVQAITGLIGQDARLLLGNTDGGTWTDLRGPAPAPVQDESVTPGAAETVADGERRLGIATPVPGTPWLLWVDLPREAALLPARQFLRQLLGMALVLGLAAAAVAYGLSRQVTRPLDQLTAAAEGLAGGDLEREVPVGRRDEVGRLARAFDRMRHQVSEAHHRLEHRVEERTRELRATLDKLHEAQEELLRQERLAILGQLASGVGHELRNPLAVMTNALYYLDMVLEEATPEVQEYLGIVRHQIGLSEKIVSDLLDFARIKTPERQELALPALADQQIERLDLGNGLAVDRRFPTDLPMAYGDPVQLGQVVLNLVTNAVQAMGDSDGTLTLRGRSPAPGTVELEVSDSGPGVPGELRDRIFEPLFTTKARGIGLGLAVSRGLAEANGGSLSLVSRPGEGAVFVLALPAAPEAAS